MQLAARLQRHCTAIALNFSDIGHVRKGSNILPMYSVCTFAEYLNHLICPRGWTVAGTPLYAMVRILLIARSVGRPIVETKETNISFGMSLLDTFSERLDRRRPPH